MLNPYGDSIIRFVRIGSQIDIGFGNQENVPFDLVESVDDLGVVIRKGLSTAMVDS